MGKAASSDRSNLKREILGISLLALAVLLALSLFSFHPDDISFNNQPSEPQKTANLAGVVGSHLADIFFQAFGLTAFLWPFALAFFALRLFRSTEFSVSPLKAICWAGLFLAVSGLLSLGLGKVNLLGASMDSGGALGKILAHTGERFLNFTGAALLLAVVLVVCMMVITNLSWVEVSNGIGQLYFSSLERWQEFLKNRRKRKKEEEREARKLREPVPAVILEQQPAAPKEKPAVVIPEKQEHFPFLDSRGAYVVPPLSLLEDPEQKEVKVDKESLLANAKILEKRLSDFGVQGKVNEVRPGPVITMYEYEPAPGVKINKIVGLSDDLALALRAISVRIVAPIPGKAAVGI